MTATLNIERVDSDENSVWYGYLFPASESDVWQVQ